MSVNASLNRLPLLSQLLLCPVTLPDPVRHAGAEGGPELLSAGAHCGLSCCSASFVQRPERRGAVGRRRQSSTWSRQRRAHPVGLSAGTEEGETGQASACRTCEHLITLALGLLVSAVSSCTDFSTLLSLLHLRLSSRDPECSGVLHPGPCPGPVRLYPPLSPASPPHVPGAGVRQHRTDLAG